MHGRNFFLTSVNKLFNIVSRNKRMLSTQQPKTYEDAVSALNTLQTNSQVLDKIRKAKRPGGTASNNLPTVLEFLQRAEMTLDELDSLKIIHVSGTKGKGSVCAFCESILRSCGFKTGFYSSPHLVEVRERIRINGQPISKQFFADSLFTVYNRLVATKDQYGGKMPAYFRFLTIMAFQVFLKEKVDVAIIEVGLGGAYDCTNIIKNPVVVGITSLGLDHVRVLGETIDKIAWQKAGICKPNRPAFTVPQPQDGMNVIFERAKELKTAIKCTPNIHEYDLQGKPLKLGLAGNHQQINASLALQLCRTWLEETHSGHIKFKDVELEPVSKKRRVECEGEGDTASGCGMPIVEPFIIPPAFIQGLQDCYWAGRTQTFKRNNITYYLDGAHTPRSIKACTNWFNEVSQEEAKTIKGPVAKALVFNSTGDRKAVSLMSPLMDCSFDGVAFCPNIVTSDTSANSADQKNYNTTLNKQLARCQSNNFVYESLLKELNFKLKTGQSSTTEVNGNEKVPNFNQEAMNVTNNGIENGLKKVQGTNEECEKTNAVFGCISTALRWLAGVKDSKLGCPLQDGPPIPVKLQNAAHIQVLVTGSLHLVGGAVMVIDPKLATTQDVEIENVKAEVQCVKV